MLSTVQDKVVQDVDGEEGTGVSHISSVFEISVLRMRRSGALKKPSVCMFLLPR